MKFLLVTNNDSDGVGQQVVNLSSNLKKRGHNSKIILLDKSKNNNEIFKIKRSFFSRLFFFTLNFLKKDFDRLFSFGNTTVSYDTIKKYIDQADVVIIYSLYKLISIKMLEKICQTKKIIYLRPLDMEMATGGCHENLLMDGKECKKFKSNCNNCPQLNSLNIFNLTKNNLVRKKRIIEKFRPKIFVENSFTKSIFDKSKIFEKVKTKVIFLGINKKRTKFISKYKARKILGIKPTEKVILFGSFNLDSPHKGGEILKDSLKILVSKLDKQKFYKLNFEKIKLITFGRKNKFNINIPKIDWLDLGIILSDRRLNLLYRSADLLVCPSICDNGPHVVTEALTNDLPIVAFNQGVAQDSVINGINGYLVPCFNKFLFSESIYKVLFSKRNNNKSIKIKKIKSFFSSSYEASQIIKHAYSDLKTKNN